MRLRWARAYLLLATLCMPGCGTQPRDVSKAFTIEPPIRSSAILPTAPLVTLDLLTASPSIDALPRRRVTVHDPVYRHQKTYEGPLLIDVVQELSAGRPIPSEGHLVLVCADGYRASLPMATARSGGVLARRDLDAPSDWLVLPGEQTASPGPSYLVWDGTDAASRPWPYGISAIEIWTTDPLERAKPGEGSSAAVRAGFALFAEHCVRCHRINGAGGVLSSELNIPANVTEYWNSDALQAFIRQPTSVQAEARMPAFDRLARAEQDQLTSYLAAMKYRKLPVP